MHLKINRDSQGMFLITKNRLFKTLEELVAFYRTEDSPQKYRLGDPLLTDQAQEAMKRRETYNMTDEDKWRRSESKEEQEPRFFWGAMSNQDADCKLREERPGTYLLRKNEAGLYRFSYMAEGRVRHIRQHPREIILEVF